MPRLLFGKYLSSQFEELLKKAKKLAIPITVHSQTKVLNMTYHAEKKEATIFTADDEYKVDVAVVCMSLLAQNL
nr:FAD/NAD(P)-binding protein [Pseudopedobacter sp.]